MPPQRAEESDTASPAAARRRAVHMASPPLALSNGRCDRISATMVRPSDKGSTDWAAAFLRRSDDCCDEKDSCKRRFHSNVPDLHPWKVK